MLRKFLKFGLVGVAGFLVDAGVLLLLKPVLGPFAGRAISFLAAVTTTFALNRRFVFGEAAPAPLLKQWFGFLAANCVGGALNLGVYGILLAAHVTEKPIVALVWGSLAGWAANFTLSDRFVFQTKRPPSPDESA